MIRRGGVKSSACNHKISTLQLGHKLNRTIWGAVLAEKYPLNLITVMRAKGDTLTQLISWLNSHILLPSPVFLREKR